VSETTASCSITTTMVAEKVSESPLPRQRERARERAAKEALASLFRA
jgi:hypothetical protein